MNQAPAPREPKEMEIIDLDSADPGFAREVVEAGGRGLLDCYGCGACSAFCPILPQVSGYDPRRLIRLILLGQREAVLSQPLIWSCSTCYNCQEVCPRQVSFTEIGFVLKNLATAAGFAPPSLPGQAGLLSEHGRLYEITDFENDKRAKLGLPPVSEAPADYDRLLAGLRKRLKPAGQEGGPA